MPNHVHLVMVPREEDGLRATSPPHRQYSRSINFREDSARSFWQERFHSCRLERTCWPVRYVEQNPVKAGLVRRPANWPWSSARAHLEGRDDERSGPPMLKLVGDWSRYLKDKNPADEEASNATPAPDARWVTTGFCAPSGSPAGT